MKRYAGGFRGAARQMYEGKPKNFFPILSYDSKIGKNWKGGGDVFPLVFYKNSPVIPLVFYKNAPIIPLVFYKIAYLCVGIILMFRIIWHTLEDRLTPVCKNGRTACDGNPCC